MEKTIESVRSNFNSMRTARANPSILDWFEVEYYGTPVNVKSIAQISTPDASSMLVQPYDKSSLKAIEKAIVTTDLGLTPDNDGEVLWLSLPQLTSERRKEKKLSEDNVKDLSSDLHKVTDDYIKKVEAAYKQKEKVELGFGNALVDGIFPGYDIRESVVAQYTSQLGLDAPPFFGVAGKATQANSWCYAPFPFPSLAWQDNTCSHLALIL
ncbi:ribosome recycling factor, chloroplast precursor [Actinidia rufa]|uniref:Ribosome-recycling factor, chloroplastic n=1 Tax=Actinidia rufa TaxID=165716 RepID=A0A7J0GY60_9ERIC|nr:ribosome recycling factor, chloroplast precursor [Actinidia rufa]